MKRLDVSSFGPLRECAVAFGDLTVLVGPQASGKSLFAQLYKSIEDLGPIRDTFRRYGFEWQQGNRPSATFLNLYYGEGMELLLSKETQILKDGKAYPFRESVSKRIRSGKKESVFFIPAQRVLVFQDGWPRPFMSYTASDPYCVRAFSESLRMLMDMGLGGGDAIFPQKRRLKNGMRNLLNASIYDNGTVKLQTEGNRKKLALIPPGQAGSIPFNVWSAGQREFTPLLLGLYHLLPPGKNPKRPDISTVIIEEPEMGLHPQAIISFFLLVLELLHRGYKVILSTHSPTILDLVWMIQELKQLPHQIRTTKTLAEAFGIPLSHPLKEILTHALRKAQFRSYYFDRRPDGVHVRDISTLDPSDEDDAVSGWGGLSGFSGKIAELVGQALRAKG